MGFIVLFPLTPISVLLCPTDFYDINVIPRRCSCWQGMQCVSCKSINKTWIKAAVVQCRPRNAVFVDLGCTD